LQLIGQPVTNHAWTPALIVDFDEVQTFHSRNAATGIASASQQGKPVSDRHSLHHPVARAATAAVDCISLFDPEHD